MSKALKWIWVAILIIAFGAMIYFPVYQRLISLALVGGVSFLVGIFAALSPRKFTQSVDAADWLTKSVYPKPRLVRLLGIFMAFVGIFCLRLI